MDSSEKIIRWQRELARIRGVPSRWGESRRFAGKSAGNRLARIDWLVEHIAALKAKHILQE
jgi:hypothetical protein